MDTLNEDLNFKV